MNKLMRFSFICKVEVLILFLNVILLEFKAKEFLMFNVKNITKTMLKKNLLLIFLVVSLQIVFGQDDSASTETQYTLKTVVIDAGHGGKDPGCHGAAANEKDICLSIALKLGAYIEENFPDVNVIYTRKTDVFLELHERSDIANKNNADLFISIHANSASPSAYGTETFIMGTKYEDKNGAIARENSVIQMEENYEENYELNLESPQAKILYSMMQQEYHERSFQFAQKIEREFSERVGRHSRGVRQSVLYVMYRTACPSVLIETGFLTNKKEEEFLNSDKGQSYMASAIYRAFREYKLEVEGNTPEEIKAIIKEMQEKAKQREADKANGITEEKKEEEEHHEHNDDHEGHDHGGESKEEKKEDAKEIKQEDDKMPRPTTKVIKTDVKLADESKETNKEEEKKDQAVYYSVQLTSSSDQIETSKENFKGLEEVFEYEQGGWYKYASGKFSTFEEAYAAQSKIRELGFDGAFVVAFENGKRISIEEAKKKLKQ